MRSALTSLIIEDERAVDLWMRPKAYATAVAGWCEANGALVKGITVARVRADRLEY